MVNVGGGKHFFAIAAYDVHGNKSRFSEELSVTINTSKPGAVTNFKVTITATGVIIEAVD